MTPQTPAERLQELTDQLENGIQELFSSGRYAEYLKTLSKFHHYSFGNVLLITLQFPAASRVAGFQTWKNTFGRTVKKGEKGIKILAPIPYKTWTERDKVDPATMQPVLDSGGAPLKEQVLVQRQRFHIATVFDISQTEGKELLVTCANELTGDVAQYRAMLDKLTALSPVPIDFASIPGTAKGYFSHDEQRIVVQSDMSQMQTVKTVIHEIAHAMLHNNGPDGNAIPPEERKDRRTREVEAESIAYVVCQYFGIDTSEYSFSAALPGH